MTIPLAAVSSRHSRTVKLRIAQHVKAVCTALRLCLNVAFPKPKLSVKVRRMFAEKIPLVALNLSPIQD